MKQLFTLFLCCLFKTSISNTYYVSQSTGDNKRSVKAAQNSATPWQTINKINSITLKTGDSVLFKCGDLWIGSTLIPQANGLTFSCYGKGALPIIDGSEKLALSVSTKRNLTFASLIFKRSHQKSIIAQFGQAWSKINAGLLSSKIKNCRFFGGIEIQGSYNRFENNIIDGAQNDGNGNGIWEHHEYCHHNTYKGNTIRNFSLRGIWTMIDTHDGIFEANTVYDCKLAGIDLDGADYVVYKHTVRNNYIYNIQTDAIELENAFSCSVTGNKLRKGGHAYIYIINYEKCKILNGFGAKNGIGALLNTTIAHNDMVGGGLDEHSLAIGIYKAGGINIFNNTIYNFKSRFFDLDYKSASEVPKIRLVNNIFSSMRNPSWYGIINFSTNDFRILAEDDYNCFYNNGRNDIYADRSTNKQRGLAEYSRISGKGKHSIISDPMFVDGEDVHLKRTSPCVGTGKKINPKSSKPLNIGAY